LTVDIQAILVTPADSKGPVPVILQFNPGGNGMCVRAPAAPRGGAAGAGTGAGRGAGAAATGAGAPPLPAAAGATPAAGGRGAAAPVQAAGGRGAAAAGGGGRGGGNTPQQQLLAKGWGYASLLTGSVQQDNGDCLTSGIIGLVNKGQPRKLDDWGVLA